MPKSFLLNSTEEQATASSDATYEPEFYNLGQSLHYQPRIELFRQDSPVQDVFVLKRGVVKLIRVEEDGREMIVGLRSPTWILGAASLVTNKAHVVTGVSVTSCDLQRIPAKPFLALLQSNAKLSWSLHQMHCNEIREQFMHVSALGYMSAMHRLKHLLWQLASMMKFTAPEKSNSLKLPLKHWEIAQLIAVTPEHLSRLLKKMQHEGIIRVENGRLLIADQQNLQYTSGAPLRRAAIGD